MFKILFLENKRLGISTILFLILYSAYNPALSKLIQYNMSMAENPLNFNLVKLLTINIGVFLLLSLINWCSQYFAIKFYTSSQDKLNSLFFKKIANDHSELKQSEIVKIFNNDIPLIIDSYIPSIISMLYFIFSFSFGTILIFSLNKTILLYLVLIAVLSLTVAKVMSKRISPAQKKYNDSLSNNSEILLDIFDHSMIRRIFALTPILEKKFRLSSNESCSKLFTLKKQKNIVTFSNDSFTWLLQLGLYIIGALLISQNKLTFAELIAITQASGTITTPIFWFSNTLADIYSTKDIRDVVEAVLSKKEKRTNDKIQIPEITRIKCKDLTVNFNNGKTIGPISLTLEKNKKYALIGNNGSGKSTIFSALSLEIENFSGNILLDHHDLNQIDANSYFKKIAIVTQKTKLYQGTVLENITCFSEDINLVILEKIKRLFSNQDPAFLDYSVDQLSGGQKQLVTIARALYKEAPFIYLDEPFSALDKATIQRILNILLELKDTTILLSIHHYDSEMLDHFDEVLRVGDHSCL